MNNDENNVTESFRYRTQSSKYTNNKNEIINLLNSLEAKTLEVEEMLTASDQNAKNDYFSKKVYDGNENIKLDIKDIGNKLEAIAGSLAARARELDKEESNKDKIESS